MSETHAQTVTFFRETMLPPVPPPITERGAVKWLRENLFSTPFNIALTLLGVVIVYWLVSSSLPWWLNSVWNASSLSECREIVIASAGEGATGACWAMVRNWWSAFIFGFYPPEEWWRPVLSLGLLFAALSPALFAGQKGNLTTVIGAAAVFLVIALYLAGAPTTAFVLGMVLILGLLALAQLAPGKLFWFTLAYPALMFWLLWGGSVWLPIVGMAGFGVLYVVFRLGSPFLGLAPAAGLGVVAAVFWWLYVDIPVVNLLQGLLPFEIAAIQSDRFGGFLLATVIGVTAITFSLPIGILLALGRQSDMLIVKTLSVGFIEFVRGVPLITLLFTASLLLQYFLPPGTNFDIILRVIILVTLFAAAYLAEVIRGGLAALPRGQYEAADALGLDYWRAQRLIILPQALKISIPAIVSTFIGLFKDTTLVSFVGLMDPLRGVTQIVRADINWKGIYWEPYIFVGAIFFLICFGMSRYSMYLEQKLKTDHR
jgi:general L-amino acid transport system permease protein